MKSTKEISRSTALLVLAVWVLAEVGLMVSAALIGSIAEVPDTPLFIRVVGYALSLTLTGFAMVGAISLAVLASFPRLPSSDD